MVNGKDAKSELQGESGVMDEASCQWRRKGGVRGQHFSPGRLQGPQGASAAGVTTWDQPPLGVHQL